MNDFLVYNNKRKYVNKLLLKGRNILNRDTIYVIPRIECSDGFTMSVQASSGHYCEPRENYNYNINYNKVEIGYPSEPEELLYKYAERDDDYTATVYGWVPVEVVYDVIMKHGGILEE